MKKLLFIAMLLCITAGYSQKYPAPVKLKTITINDSYKGSSVRAYRVMKSYYRRSTTNYLPAEPMPEYKTLDPLPIYYDEPKTRGGDKVYVTDDGKVYVWATSDRGITYKKYL
jgi:hypothetical protein